MGSPQLRIQLKEGVGVSGLSQKIANETGLTHDQVTAQVSILNDRLKFILNLEAAPIALNGTGGWQIDGIAGLLRFNSEVEIEIVPKFLSESEDWREDFFFIATLIRTGHLLEVEDISAGTKERGDLAILVARALIAGHLANARRPIRNYQMRKQSDFSLDGEVDLEGLSFPDSDGFRMQSISLTGANEYSAVLRDALKVLLSQVGSGDTRAMLERLLMGLKNSPRQIRVPGRLPSRHANWTDTYELSKFVLDGMGLDLVGGEFTGPGFVLATWQAWQQLCDEIILRAFKEFEGSLQTSFWLGSRIQSDVKVIPDITLYRDGKVALLVDAKYKTKFERREKVLNSDIYEAMAFMRATNSANTLLLYPDPNRLGEVGFTRHFEEIKVDPMHIDALTIQTRGISRKGGFDRLVQGVRTGVMTRTPSLQSAQD